MNRYIIGAERRLPAFKTTSLNIQRRWLLSTRFGPVLVHLLLERELMSKEEIHAIVKDRWPHLNHFCSRPIHPKDAAAMKAYLEQCTGKRTTQERDQAAAEKKAEREAETKAKAAAKARAVAERKAEAVRKARAEQERADRAAAEAKRVASEAAARAKAEKARKAKLKTDADKRASKYDSHWFWSKAKLRYLKRMGHDPDRFIQTSYEPSERKMYYLDVYTNEMVSREEWYKRYRQRGGTIAHRPGVKPSTR